MASLAYGKIGKNEKEEQAVGGLVEQDDSEGQRVLNAQGR